MPSGDTKPIQLNPDLMRVAGTTRKKRAGQKLRHKTQMSTGRLRDKLARRIQSYQDRAGRKAAGRNGGKAAVDLVVDTEPSSAFDDSLEFLQSLAKDRQKPISDKASGSSAVKVGDPRTDAPEPVAPSPLVPSPLAPSPLAASKPAGGAEPPYGALKGGKKPTFREWKRQTQKVRPSERKLSIAPIASVPRDVVDQDAAAKEVEDKESASSAAGTDQAPESTPRERALAAIKKDRAVAKKKMRQKAKSRARARTLGKRGRSVSILIKNQRTRRAVQREQGIMRAKKLADIKEYLRKRNLIKSGSLAPADVLRRMYEEAVMSGDVKNLRGEALVNNYMEAEKTT